MRTNVTCGTSIITGLVVYAPEWPDDTTPRTDAPVRFNRGLHQYESLQYGQLRATFRFSPSFIAR